jgi:hypothetical protein
MKVDWKLVLPSDALYDSAHPLKYWCDAFGLSDLRATPDGERPFVSPDDHIIADSAGGGGAWSLALVPNVHPTRPFSLIDGLGSRWIATHS